MYYLICVSKFCSRLESWKCGCKSNLGKRNLCLNHVKGLIVLTSCLHVENLCFRDGPSGLLGKYDVSAVE